jgi:hypothetical protein
MTSQRESAATVAELHLEKIPHRAGPFIGGSVRIAPVKNVDHGWVLLMLQTVEPLEEGN